MHNREFALKLVYSRNLDSDPKTQLERNARDLVVVDSIPVWELRKYYSCGTHPTNFRLSIWSNCENELYLVGQWLRMVHV